MSGNPPAGFEELGSVVAKAIDTEICVIGVVSHFFPATKTRGTDYMITFTLTDPSVKGVGLKCRFYRPSEQALPSVSSQGDVVVLRSVRLKNFNGQLLALSNHFSSWTVFHQQDIPTSNTELGVDLPFAKMSDQVPSPSKEVMAYVVTLYNFLDRSTFSEPPAVTSLQANDSFSLNGNQTKKFQLIQDLTLPRTNNSRKYADLLGEVRRVYMNDFRVELTITDYTFHESLYDYAHESNEDLGRDGDPFNYVHNHKPWPGPWGKMSMMVTLWDEHATFARDNVGVKSLVYLTNVQIGYDREGTMMEGRLHGNQYNKLCIRICKPQHAQEDERIKAFLKRKRDYEAELRLHGIKGLEEWKKQSQETSKQPPAEKELTPAEKKKRQREKRKAKKKALNATTDRNPPKPPILTNTLNPNIRTNKPPSTLIPVKISEILDPSTLVGPFTTPAGNTFTLPFKNNLYHLKPIRVIDFHPPNIADFAAPHRHSDYEALSDYESDEPSSDVEMTDADAEMSWEWRFELLVEDFNPKATLADRAKGRMKLLIAGTDADFLLRNVKATDLRRDGRSLARLKEKLFLLWGDLLERKEEMETAAAAGGATGRGDGGGEGIVDKSKSLLDDVTGRRPFECLVREYGVQVPGPPPGERQWERVFAMCGTSIVE